MLNNQIAIYLKSALSLYGDGVVVIPVMPSNDNMSLESTLENSNLCRRFEKIKNSSDRAKDSPGQMRGPNEKGIKYSLLMISLLWFRNLPGLNSVGSVQIVLSKCTETRLGTIMVFLGILNPLIVVSQTAT